MNITMLQVGPIGTNCYVLCDETEKKCAVIDPGGDPQRVERVVAGTGCAPTAILLTHGHYDHTGAVDALLSAWPGVAAYISPKDPLGQEIFPALQGEVRHYDEGDTLAVGRLRVQVLATPGHSAGSVTLRCDDVLFCGDTLFAGSCGRTDLAGGSMEEILQSLRRLGELEGNLTVCPGHMETSNLEREQRENPYLRQALGKSF